MKDLTSSASSNLPNTARLPKHESSSQFKSENHNLIIEHLAREIWAAFDYMSPIPPGELANFVVKQIEIAGYKIIKDKG